MESVKNWILGDGRLISDALEFIEQFADKLQQAGIPVSRLRVGFQTIHPQLDVWAYVWSKTDQKAIHWGGEHGIRKSDSYIGSPAEWVHKTQQTLRRRLDQLDPKTDHPVLFAQAEEGLIDYVMLPLKFLDNTTPVFNCATNSKTGFSDQNVLDLEQLAPYLSLIIEIHATRSIAITLLDTYVGHRSGERIMNGQFQRGDGEVIEAAIWFSDLRKFTEMSENLEKEEMFGLLNRYFQIIGDSVSSHGGEILKFIGDAVLAVFPVDETTSKTEACDAALLAAQQAFQEKTTENQTREEAEQPTIDFGIGLHFGKAIYGNVGSENRLDFTVMGPAVNLTSRLENLTKSSGEHLLYSQKFSENLTSKSKKLGNFQLRGIKREQTIFTPD
ncbi:MAG: adenylate/guanylate cyclase domain-containing protein [Sneathiella sp.]